MFMNDLKLINSFYNNYYLLSQKSIEYYKYKIYTIKYIYLYKNEKQIILIKTFILIILMVLNKEITTQHKMQTYSIITYI